jgi:hypothetical protein
MPSMNPNKASDIPSGHRRRNKNTLKGRPAPPAVTKQTDSEAPLEPTTSTVEEPTPDEDIPICFICAEQVKFWGVSQCNHRTCHVCALRLRALYKRMDCTFCKASPITISIFISINNVIFQEDQPLIIFTSDAGKTFSSYTPDEIPFKDSKLSISFETQEMMEETLILLRFNCPDTSCDYIAGGWNDLKMHGRAVHGRQMWFVHFPPWNLRSLINRFLVIYALNSRKCLRMSIRCTPMLN